MAGPRCRLQDRWNQQARKNGQVPSRSKVTVADFSRAEYYRRWDMEHVGVPAGSGERACKEEGSSLALPDKPVARGGGVPTQSAGTARTQRRPQPEGAPRAGVRQRPGSCRATWPRPTSTPRTTWSLKVSAWAPAPCHLAAWVRGGKNAASRAGSCPCAGLAIAPPLRDANFGACCAAGQLRSRGAYAEVGSAVSDLPHGSTLAGTEGLLVRLAGDGNQYSLVARTGALERAVVCGGMMRGWGCCSFSSQAGWANHAGRKYSS